MELRAMSTPASPPEGRVPESATATAGGGGDDSSSRTLVRILWILGLLLGLLIVVFGVVYYLGQHASSGPSLADRSVTTAEQAVRDDPNNVAARLNLATAYLESGRSEEALAQFTAITKVEPDNRAALLGSGTIRLQNEDFAGAKADFAHVVAVSGGQEFSAADPQLERAQYFLGMSALGLKDVPGAVKAFTAALAIDKTDADAWYALGGAQAQAADYKSAADSYQRALVFVPTGWCDPYAGLAAAYGQLKNSDGSAYSNAMASICNGKTDDGVSALEKLTTGEFKEQAMLGLGIAAESSNDKAKAIGWYRKVIAADPSNIAALTALARLGASEPASSSATPTPSASAS
jgi:tetratricopeptide (TPR) repeat protein